MGKYHGMDGEIKCLLNEILAIMQEFFLKGSSKGNNFFSHESMMNKMHWNMLLVIFGTINWKIELLLEKQKKLIALFQFSTKIGPIRLTSCLVGEQVSGRLSCAFCIPVCMAAMNKQFHAYKSIYSFIVFFFFFLRLLFTRCLLCKNLIN